MNRKTNRELLDKWIKENGPDGISALAVKSKVSSSTIEKARATEEAPKKLWTLQCLSKATGYNLEELFPLVRAKGKAS